MITPLMAMAFRVSVHMEQVQHMMSHQKPHAKMSKVNMDNYSYTHKTRENDVDIGNQHQQNWLINCT